MCGPSMIAAERWLFAPGSARWLARLRILISAYALVWLAAVTPELVALGDLDPTRFDPVGVVALLGGRAVSSGRILVWIVAVFAAGSAFAAGKWVRISGPLFALGMLWLTTYQNSWSKLLHSENLLVLHLLILAVSPVADASAFRGQRADSESWRYGWPVRVLAMSTVLMYLAAGVAKLRYTGVGWLAPVNLRDWIAYDLLRKELFGDPYLGAMRSLLGHPVLFAVPAVVTLVVELGAPVALWSRRVAFAWIVGAWTLHLAVLAGMSVLFPYQLTGIALLPVLLNARRVASRRPALQPST